MASSALLVAFAAGALLVGVVAVDASMNRVLHLEMQQEGRWVKVATHPYELGYVDHRGFSFAAFELNASDTVTFRVHVDNEYPWGFDESYEVRLAGRVVSEGRLAAERFSEGSDEFTLTGAQLMSDGYPAAPRSEAPADRFWSPHFEVRVGDEHFSGGVGFQEVSR